MKTNGTCSCPCSDYMTVPLDDPSMLEYNATTYSPALANIYVPRQPERSAMFSLCDGFARGTVYKALYVPYEPENCVSGGGCCG